jgi:hypothetical protein
MKRRDLLKLTALAPVMGRAAGTRREISGVYPHLAMFNESAECGTGAVVPWAGKLWALTYSPHQPGGSSDKLYEIDESLNAIVRPESIGGTPANRMIHRESGQLFLGPYVIDRERRVRGIPYTKAFGRPTGNARHLKDPANKIYLATMEEGFYEVDVHTLEVTRLYEDANAMFSRKEIPNIEGPLLPGYHGKGLYSGQGRLVYANNVRRPKSTAEHSVRMPGRVERRRVEGGAPKPVLRRDRPGWPNREPAACDGPHLEHWMGPPLLAPDGSRRRALAHVPSAQGHTHLRRRSWMEHGVAPYS